MFLSTEKALIPFYTLETTTGHRQSYLCFPVHLINIIKDKSPPEQNNLLVRKKKNRTYYKIKQN